MFTPYITTVLPWEPHQTMLTSPHINPVVKPSLRKKKTQKMCLEVRGTNSKLLIAPRGLSRLRQPRNNLLHQILQTRGSFCLLGKRNET